MGEFDFNGLFEHLSAYLKKLVGMFFQVFFWLRKPGEDNKGWETETIPSTTAKPENE